MRRLALALAATTAVVLVLRHRYLSVQVVGTSMTPTLRPGERIIVRRTTVANLRHGQIVVLANSSPAPDDPPWLVKRLTALPGDPIPRDTVPALRDVPEQVVPPNRLVILGDNDSASHDSRTVGYYDATTLLGVAVRQRLTV
ncbi:S26 family signal peptidase [Kribbella sp. NBC_00382]|uniref:S26 family signal peptidase n=1 Tax=Kribbella sp. NBC_00382 TaxID=2975967 RepID=UPI002E212B54